MLSVFRVRDACIAALAVLACGPAEPEYEIVTVPSGRPLAVEEIAEIRLPDGEPALLLRYRTALELTDRAALEAEVDEAWSYLRPRAEDRDFDAAVIRAARWEKPGWERRGSAAEFVVGRALDGSWTVRVAASVEAASGASER